MADRQWLHARRLGRNGRRYWLLREVGDRFDDLGYARRLGFARWQWEDKHGAVLSEPKRSVKQVARRADRVLDGREIGDG